MSRSRKRPATVTGWQPLDAARNLPWSSEKREALRASVIAQQPGIDADKFLAEAEAESEQAEVYMNDRYVVSVDRRPDDHSVISLGIRRRDRKPIRDWRDFQRIKNQLAGYETEAVELFPADSRLMDSANQYWLWCLRPGEQWPFGMQAEHALVHDWEVAGSRQRPIADVAYTQRTVGSLGA